MNANGSKLQNVFMMVSVAVHLFTKLLPVILIQWILRNECAKTSMVEAPYLCATVNSKQKYLCCILWKFSGKPVKMIIYCLADKR